MATIERGGVMRCGGGEEMSGWGTWCVIWEVMCGMLDGLGLDAGAVGEWRCWLDR